MSRGAGAESGSVPYGRGGIDFTVVRRARATLEIAVEPDMRVVIAAPLEASMAAIEAKVLKRAPWVRRQQRFFNQFQPRTPPRGYVSGETHLYLGRQYRLRVRRGAEDMVKLADGFIWVTSRRPKQQARTRRLVEAWFLARARAKFAERLDVCLAAFADPGRFTPQGVIIRDMKLRWGSMPPSGRLVLNRRLVQAPVDAVDYVITHELCHLAHPHHGAGFMNLLSRVMPDWRRRKTRLERVMA